MEKPKVESSASSARNLVAAITVAVFALGTTTPAMAQSEDRLYEAAKNEKSVSIWAGGPTAGYEAAARAFEQKYPGIKVELTGGFSNVLNAKIEDQIKTGKVEADVVIFQTVQDLVNWKKRNLLTHFKPEAFDQIPASQKDADGAWIAVNTNPIYYGYSTEKLRPEDVPRSAADFLKPMFKGRLITVYPADDDA